MQSRDLEELARRLSGQIRGRFYEHTHPTYGLQLIYALWQAKLCGYHNITVIEFGVASGRGFTALKNFAAQYAPEFDINVEVKGFDSGHGLPAATDYRDHPEIWSAGDYASRMPDSDVIFGDVKLTVPEFVGNWGDRKLGFVSLDLDLYTSTRDALQIFNMPADNFLPSVMVHLDDAFTHLTMNPWCGAELAVSEFNQTHTHRKFELKDSRWGMPNFYALHVLDHPMRTGQQRPRLPINCSPI
jgi:hypothetical protein